MRAASTVLICFVGLEQIPAQEVVLTVSNANNTREGQVITFPVMLKSNGDVGGITFNLKYNEVFLGKPVFEWSSLFGLSINSRSRVVHEFHQIVHFPFLFVHSRGQSTAVV